MLVRCGRVQATLDGSALRWVSVDGLEIVSRVDMTVRDATWGTVVPTIHSVAQSSDQAGDAVRLTIMASYKAPGIDLDVLCDVLVGPSSIAYAAHHRVRADTVAGRLGVVVLLPSSLAGRPFVIHDPRGLQRIRLPRSIEPEPIATDVVAASWWPGAGLHALVEFEGELWEMEDQRNWSDTAFKLYPRPVRLPAPYVVAAGTKGTTSARLVIRGQAKPRRPRREMPIRIFNRTAGRMPSMGAEARTLPAPLLAWRAALELGLGHVRVGLDARSSGLESAARRIAEVRSGGLPYEADVIADGERQSLSEIARILKSGGCVGVNLFASDSPDALRSDPMLVQRWSEIGEGIGLDVPIGAGTRGQFAELSASRPVLRADVVTLGVSAQSHAFDEISVLETVQAVADVTREAATLAGGRPLSVVASCRPRPSAIDEPIEEDARFLGPLGAAWVTGLAAVMTAPSVCRVSWLTLNDWMLAWADDLPVARVMKSLCELGGVLRLAAPSRSDTATVALRHSEGYRVLVANLGRSSREITIILPVAGPWRERSLTSAASAPDVHREGPVVTLGLDYLEVKRLDLWFSDQTR
jgi:hypothetical protein